MWQGYMYGGGEHVWQGDMHGGAMCGRGGIHGWETYVAGVGVWRGGREDCRLKSVV